MMQLNLPFPTKSYPSPDEFIESIRNSYVHAETVYTHGACFQFHLILKTIWPDAIPWYDGGHVTTEIGGAYWDITGEVKLTSSAYPLAQEPRILEEAYTWWFALGLVGTDFYS